jgi:glycerol-3-phosphate acyltransferase PlsX
LDTRGLEHVVAEQVVAMDEKPAEAVRSKPDSSLVASCRAIAAGTADAVVSAGNTGAMLAAGLLEIRRVTGVARPAIAVPIPARDGPSVLLDCGANADARPEHLLQFGTWARSSRRRSWASPGPRCGSSRSARRRRKETS